MRAAAALGPQLCGAFVPPPTPRADPINNESNPGKRHQNRTVSQRKALLSLPCCCYLSCRHRCCRCSYPCHPPRHPPNSTTLVSLCSVYCSSWMKNGLGREGDVGRGVGRWGVVLAQGCRQRHNRYTHSPSDTHCARLPASLCHLSSLLSFCLFFFFKQVRQARTHKQRYTNTVRCVE